MQPMRHGQLISLRLLYPILLQEINTARPSKLLHFLVGKGVLYWQDVVVIQHNRQTDLEMNPVFLRILLTRGEEGFYGFMEGLRSRHGGWQGYLADMIEMQFNPIIIRDLLDIFKIVCHDLTKLTPVGWSALPRVLGLPKEKIERARRQNRLLVNQALHSLLLWSGHRDDKEEVLNDLLIGLMKINRNEIAESIVRLVDMVHYLQRWKSPRAEEADQVFDEDREQEKDVKVADGTTTSVAYQNGLSMPPEDVEVAAVFEASSSRPVSRPKGMRRKYRQSTDSGFASPSPQPPGSSRRDEKSEIHSQRSPRSRSQQSSTPRRRKSSSQRSSTSYPRLRSLTPMSATDPESIVQTGHVYTYGLGPRRKSNAWERRTPTILQSDYTVHPNHDNLFMDYLVYQ